MTLSDVSIKNPVFAWMLMAALLLFGAIGFSRMGVSQMPDVDFPMVSIDLTWEGAAPGVMETEVVDTIEEALMTVQGIKQVSSASRQGQANITVEFELAKDIDVAVQEIQTKIAQAQMRLPRDMDPAIIQKFNPEDQPIMWVALSGTRPVKEMAEYVRDYLKDRFQTVEGVGGVFLGGFVEPNLRVWMDPQKMYRRQLTVDDIAYAIQNQHAELPAGRLETPRDEKNIRVMGEAASIEEFAGIPIPQRVGGGVIWQTFRLSDVASVEDGIADPRRLSHVMGHSAIGLGIRKQRGANAVAVARAVKKKIETLQKEIPQGMKLAVNFDSTKFIEDTIHELNRTLILASILTSLICWLFLGSWSSTINVLLAIPTSIGGAFMVMYFLGFTLNTITMLGLSLIIGVVVDDAIMVLENIVRHREMRESQIKAALLGSREITFAAVASSVAIAAIFLPVAFMKGMIGKMFFQFGVTVSVAVGFSLLEAITLTPMRCSQFLSVGHKSWVGRSMDQFMKKLTLGYRNALAATLNRRWTVILVSSFLFIGSLKIASSLRKEMSPSQDMSMFLARIQTPLGSSLAFTDSVFRKAEEWVLARGETNRYFGAIGGFGGGEINTGILFITLKEPSLRPKDPKTNKPLTQLEMMDRARKEFNSIPGVMRATIQDLSQGFMGGMRGFPIELSVHGPDWEKLGAHSETLMKHLGATGLMTDLDSDYQAGMPEVRIVPDRDKAAARGVTVASIARTVNAMFGGVRAGRYTRGGRRYDIRLSLSAQDRSRPADISKIWVRNNRGELIRLSDVTTITEKPSLLTIRRANRERTVTLTANVAPGKSQAAALESAQKIAKEILPDGYRLVLSGSSKNFKESFLGLVFALVLGIAIAYMVLGAQFNSFIHPFTVLLALPFSISGALLALWVWHHSLNIMSMIGILFLMGIVKKNSILLVDFTNARRQAGAADVKTALLEACPIRLRPILMTSLSTIAGAIPAALALGAGSESRAPMAAAVIGGMALSTFLTLFVVPCAYSLLSGLESKKRQKALALVLEELESLGESPIQR